MGWSSLHFSGKCSSPWTNYNTFLSDLFNQSGTEMNDEQNIVLLYLIIMLSGDSLVVQDLWACVIDFVVQVKDSRLSMSFHVFAINLLLSTWRQRINTIYPWHYPFSAGSHSRHWPDMGLDGSSLPTQGRHMGGT